MNSWKLHKPRSRGRGWLVLLTALLLVSGLVSLQAPAPAWAIRPPGDPLDPGGGGDDPFDWPEPPFQPPEGGFSWSVPRRYGLDANNDRMIDAHYNAATYNYDQDYIYPDHWPMQFWGCQTEHDDLNPTSTDLTYTWLVDGHTFSGLACALTYDDPGFAAQGSYPVTLTVTYPDGTTASFSQDVYIRDYFLVTVGDSYAAGEGNPDIPQTLEMTPFGYIVTGPATWQDQRCHRSAKASSSQAAMALEWSDPHTSVTFISYACSGATISTPLYDSAGLFPSWSLPRGTGLTGPYRGQDVPSGTPYDLDTYVPSQLGQLQLALQPPAGQAVRQIDALVVSGGGNDLHFGDILTTCVLGLDCYPDSLVWEDPDHQVEMGSFLNAHASTNLPAALADLRNGIEEVNNLLPQPAEVFIMQYPDQTRSDSPGVYCDLLWDVLWGSMVLKITPEESQLLVTHALHPLNAAIQEAARIYGWQYVDGLASYEVDPAKPAGTPGLFVQDPGGYGHGYCASNNWIIRAEQAELVQGPWPFQRFRGTGAMHPWHGGITAQRDRLLYYLRPYLNSTLPGDPPGDPPTFSSSPTSGGLTSVPGASGWYTQACDGSGTCSPQVVLQVTVTGSAPLRSTSLYMNDNDEPGCSSVAGVTCPATVAGPNELRWDFTFSADGIYQMELSARDSNDQIGSYTLEIRVDLHDPAFDPLPGPFEVNEGITTTLTAHAGEPEGIVYDYDWDLDSDGAFETLDEQPVFSAAALDGPDSQSIGVRVADQAGRFATATATISIKNMPPEVEISGAPPSASEGTGVNLTSAVTDPGSADTFTYWWSVTTGGSPVASGSEPAVTFTPAEDGTYDISLTVADDDDGATTASQIIEVANVAPVLSNVTATPGTVDEGGSVTLAGSLSDAGSTDAFALVIGWGDGSAEELVWLPAGSTSFSVLHTYEDDNPTGTASDTYPVALTLFDDDGGTDTGSASAVVSNLAPSVSILAPESGALAAAGATVDVSASVADASGLDTVTCSVDWGDGAVGPGTLAAGVCTASHAYAVPGVYAVQVTGTDDDTGAASASVMVVVHDPSAGFVTGGGWITSPAGAYKPDPDLTGKATFGFVSKYEKGAQVPTGATEFKFHAGGFSFHSETYEWLVVNQGGQNAQFKGSGTVNGGLDPNGNEFKFMIWATDGSPDTLRIRIWWEASGAETDVYDNGVQQAIGGGSIVVHTDD
ncbi:MAG TPA: PKD domain-containing protein [Anaerolineae bacterium]|nr:PKD domain-containing protein [Anaerolineae bacterium]